MFSQNSERFRNLKHLIAPLSPAQTKIDRMLKKVKIAHSVKLSLSSAILAGSLIIVPPATANNFLDIVADPESRIGPGTFLSTGRVMCESRTRGRIISSGVLINMPATVKLSSSYDEDEKAALIETLKARQDEYGFEILLTAAHALSLPDSDDVWTGPKSENCRLDREPHHPSATIDKLSIDTAPSLELVRRIRAKDIHVVIVNKRLTESEHWSSAPMVYFDEEWVTEHAQNIAEYNDDNSSYYFRYLISGYWVEKRRYITGGCNHLKFIKNLSTRQTGVISHDCARPKGVSGGGLFFLQPPDKTAVIGVQSGSLPVLEDESKEFSVVAPVTEELIQMAVQLVLNYEKRP